jgi:hypothetical protein
MDASVYLYRHFDSLGRLLYVGIANHPKRRLVAHGTAHWHSDVLNSTYERFPNRAAAAKAEIIAIKCENPAWNVANNPGKVAKALHPIRVPKSRATPITVMVPAEPCFARKGILISFRTGGPAHHSEVKLANDGRGEHFDYHAVVKWMELFDYQFADGNILSRDESVRMDWIDALTHEIGKKRDRQATTEC